MTSQRALASRRSLGLTSGLRRIRGTAAQEVEKKGAEAPFFSFPEKINQGTGMTTMLRLLTVPLLLAASAL